MIPKFDGRKRYASVVPPYEHLREIFAFQPRTGNLWFAERPRHHFESKKDQKEWNDKFAFACLGADISMNPAWQLNIPFYYKWEKNTNGMRSCYASELIFGWLEVPYNHHWPLVFRDGNRLNTHLLNIQISHPTYPDWDLGFSNERRVEGASVFEGHFPKLEGGIEHIEIHFSDAECGYDESNPPPRVPKLKNFRKDAD